MRHHGAVTVHSYHLAHVPLLVAGPALLRDLGAPGLARAEVMASMELGSAVFSPRRMQVTRMAVFAEWADPGALDAFLDGHPLGRHLDLGWHVRLEFLRRWGSVPEFAHLPEIAGRGRLDEPTVAFTLARTRLPELPRFIRWGRPVERQVRDHPEVTLAVAAMRPAHTLSTFSIWSSARAMTGMVFGRDSGDAGHRHAEAMTERDRRDFHHAFTTLRFRPLSEHGTWAGRSSWLPT